MPARSLTSIASPVPGKTMPSAALQSCEKHSDICLPRMHRYDRPAAGLQDAAAYACLCTCNGQELHKSGAYLSGNVVHNNTGMHAWKMVFSRRLAGAGLAADILGPHVDEGGTSATASANSALCRSKELSSSPRSRPVAALKVQHERAGVQRSCCAAASQMPLVVCRRPLSASISSNVVPNCR